MSAKLPIPGGGGLSQIFGDDWRQFYHFTTQMEPVVRTFADIFGFQQLDPEGAIYLRVIPTNLGVQLTGLYGGSNGREITITNAADTTPMRVLDDAPVDPANTRFKLPLFISEMTISAGASFKFWYDGVIERWRPIGGDIRLGRTPDFTTAIGITAFGVNDYWAKSTINVTVPINAQIYVNVRRDPDWFTNPTDAGERDDFYEASGVVVGNEIEVVVVRNFVGEARAVLFDVLAVS